MSDKLIESATQLLDYVDNGDYMTALSYFEAEVREVLDSMEAHENQALLDIMKTTSQLVDEENWQQILYNCETMKELLHG